MLKCGQPQLVTIEFLEQVETLEKYFFSPWLWLRQIAVLRQFCADVISAFINTQQLGQFFQVKKSMSTNRRQETISMPEYSLQLKK